VWPPIWRQRDDLFWAQMQMMTAQQAAMDAAQQAANAALLADQLSADASMQAFLLSTMAATPPLKLVPPSRAEAFEAGKLVRVSDFDEPPGRIADS